MESVYWAQVMPRDSTHYLMLSIVLLGEHPLMRTQYRLHVGKNMCGALIATTAHHLPLISVFVPIVASYALVNVVSYASPRLVRTGMMYASALTSRSPNRTF